MSEIAGTQGETRTARTTRTTGEAHPTPSTEPPAHEAYAFACMRCGHGWEQSYEIEHHVDAEGRTHAVYLADGERVPSPLTRPTCLNCGGHVVRIMRAGQVSLVSDALASLHQRHPAARTGSVQEAPAGPEGAEPGGEDPARAGEHHWHLSDLLHPFQHHHRK